LVKPAAHDSLVGCSNHSSLNCNNTIVNLFGYNKHRKMIFLLCIRVLELVDRTILSFVDVNHERSIRSSDSRRLYDDYYRGYSLKGKTTILRIVNLGSIPDISTLF
jgi:hypothetical protein